MKLTQQKADAIRKRLSGLQNRSRDVAGRFVPKDPRNTREAVAREYGVSVGTIDSLMAGRIWTGTDRRVSEGGRVRVSSHNQRRTKSEPK